MRDAPVLLWPPRLALGFVATVVVLIFTGNILGFWSLLPALIVGAATAWRSNGRRLLQIGAELAGKSNPSMSTSATSSNIQLVQAINIHPGDWACSHAKYQKMREEAERQYHLVKERAEKRRAASGQANASQSESDHALMQYPAIPLEWVIAIEKSPGKNRVSLRFASGDVYDAWRDQQYYRRRPKDKSISDILVKEAALALGELFALLTSGSVCESDLINKLLKKSHSEPAVHRALRAALSQRLIKQEVGFGRCFREICSVFVPRMDARLRRRCLVSLSRAGAAWTQDSDVSATRNGIRKSSHRKAAPGAINNIFINDPIFHTVISAQGGAASNDGQKHGGKNPGERPTVSENRVTPATRDSSDGLTVAWSAGVSATGAGLATLLLTGQAPWQRALFISLIFISGCTFVILICVGLPNMLSWRRARRRPSLGGDSSAEPDTVERGSD